MSDNASPDLICNNCRRASKAKDGRTWADIPIGPCYCDTLRGAASRSEQSADTWTCGRCALVFMSADAFTKHKLAGHAAAEAAQSPQVGAAPEEESRFPEGSAGELAEMIVGWADFSLAHLSEHEPTYWIKNLRLVGAKWLREHAEPGPSVSGSLPNEPSESTPKELLREVALAVRSLACSERPDLVDRIDAALSRLAGQTKDKPK
jgi:hypothetical protein